MAAPSITYGLTNKVSNSTLTETVVITDDVAISTSGVTVIAPILYKIYKEQISTTEVKLTITIPVTGTITISADDGTDTTVSSQNYIVTPLYDGSSTLPFVSIVGNSLTAITSGSTYTEQGAIAYDSDGNDISSEIQITKQSPHSTGTIASGLGENSISVISNTIDLGSPAPITGTLIFFSSTNGFEINGKVVTSNMIFSVVNPSGNNIQLAYSENGNALEITSNGAGEFGIDSTDIIDTSSPGNYVISYSVVDSDGNTSLANTRMVMVKTSEEVTISPSNDISISNTEIRHSLEEEEVRSYGIPYALSDTLPSNSLGGVPPDSVSLRYIKVDGTIPFEGTQSMGWYRLTDVADAINPSDAVNLAQLNDALSRTGTPVINTASVSQTSTGTVDTLAVSGYRAIKWLISIEDPVGDTFYGTELMAMRTNSSIDFCEYNIIGDGSGYDITAAISGINIELRITNPLNNLINVEFIRFKIS